MERHIRDVLEEEVIYDQSQFGLLNNQIDDISVSPSLVSDPPRNKKPVNKWGKLARTAALCGAYVSLGLCMSVTGPTLLYLKDQVGSTIAEISYIFTVRSIGTLGGAFLGGFFLDKCNPYSTFFVIIAMMAISVGSMPWCKHIWMLMVSSFVVGVGNGLLDTGASTLCLQLWGKDSGPYMQALHFSFAVGGSIAPLLVQAFIVETSIAAVNNTISSRHVRSVTHPLNSSESEDQITIPSIIKAVNETPDLVTSNPTILTSNSAIPAALNSTSGNVTSTITINPAVNQNQTTLATEKPKKPKPSFINGQILGPSSQFDKKPLKIETPAPQEVVIATTTASSNENRTTPDITLASTDIAIAPSTNLTTTKAQDANMTVTTMILHNSKEVQELNISISDNDSLTISSKNESTGNDPAMSSKTSSPAMENSPVATILQTTVELVINSSKSTAKGKPTRTSVKNVTEGGDLDVQTFHTTTPPTTSTFRPSITTQSSTIVSSSSSILKTMTSSSIDFLPTTIKNISFLIPVATTMPVDSTDTMVVKSRGKSRGQQDEDIAVVSSTTPVTPVTTSEPNVVVSTTNTPIHNESETIDRAPVKVSDYLERFGVTRMHMLYTVIAIIVLHTAFSFLFFLCSGTRNLTAERQTSDRKIKPFRPNAKLSFVILMFSFYLMYVGSEVVFAQFLTTFALESPLKLTTSTANYITTTFWASFAAARFVAIFVAHFTNPTIMLIFNLCSTALGSMTLCVAGQTDATILYVGSALVGIGMASTFATGFLWTEKHLLVTNRISAAFSVASSMGEMIFPTVTGALIEWKPLSLMYIVLGCTILMAFLFFVAWYLSKRKVRGFNGNSRGYHLARQVEDESAQN